MSIRQMPATTLPTPTPFNLVAVPLERRRSWPTAGWRADRSDKRDYARRDLSCDVWLIDRDGQAVIRCKSGNICDSGLFATAPVGFGLGVGQRYEVRVAGGASQRQPAHLGASLGYGTVLRTEVHVDPEGADRVGVAIRLDVPQLLPV